MTAMTGGVVTMTRPQAGGKGDGSHVRRVERLKGRGVRVRVCVYVYVHIYIYIYIHIYTHV